MLPPVELLSADVIFLSLETPAQAAASENVSPLASNRYCYAPFKAKSNAVHELTSSCCLVDLARVTGNPGDNICRELAKNNTRECPQTFSNFNTA